MPSMPVLLLVHGVKAKASRNSLSSFDSAGYENQLGMRRYPVLEMDVSYFVWASFAGLHFAPIHLELASASVSSFGFEIGLRRRER